MFHFTMENLTFAEKKVDFVHTFAEKLFEL